MILKCAALSLSLSSRLADRPWFQSCHHCSALRSGLQHQAHQNPVLGQVPMGERHRPVGRARQNAAQFLRVDEAQVLQFSISATGASGANLRTVGFCALAKHGCLDCNVCRLWSRFLAVKAEDCTCWQISKVRRICDTRMSCQAFALVPLMYRIHSSGTSGQCKYGFRVHVCRSSGSWDHTTLKPLASPSALTSLRKLVHLCARQLLLRAATRAETTMGLARPLETDSIASVDARAGQPCQQPRQSAAFDGNCQQAHPNQGARPWRDGHEHANGIGHLPCWQTSRLGQTALGNLFQCTLHCPIAQDSHISRCATFLLSPNWHGRSSVGCWLCFPVSDIWAWIMCPFQETTYGDNGGVQFPQQSLTISLWAQEQACDSLSHV